MTLDVNEIKLQKLCIFAEQSRLNQENLDNFE